MRPIVYSELGPTAVCVVTVIGDVDSRACAEISRHLRAAGVDAVLDLRFVWDVDDEACAALIDASATVAEVVLPPRLHRPVGASSQVRAAAPMVPPSLHRAPFGVAVQDHDLRYVFVNDAFAALDGIAAQAHYGLTISDLFDGSSEELGAVLRRVGETGRAERRRMSLRLGEVSGDWVCHFGPVDGPLGRSVISVVGSVGPVTEPDLDLSLRHRSTAGGIAAGGRWVGELGHGFTQREREVLTGLAAGLSNRVIAEQLFLSIDTVKTYCRRIYKKLGVSNRTDAARHFQTSTPPRAASRDASPEPGGRPGRERHR